MLERLLPCSATQRWRVLSRGYCPEFCGDALEREINKAFLCTFFVESEMPLGNNYAFWGDHEEGASSASAEAFPTTSMPSRKNIVEAARPHFCRRR